VKKTSLLALHVSATSPLSPAICIIFSPRANWTYFGPEKSQGGGREREGKSHVALLFPCSFVGLCLGPTRKAGLGSGWGIRRGVETGVMDVQ